MTPSHLKPIWTVAQEVRLLVDPARIPGDVVHYSIPALETTGEPVIEPASDIRSGKLLLRGDEILISRLNPRKSRVVRAKPAALPILASTEFVPLRPIACDPRFLTYCLLSETTRQLLDSEVRSVTRSHQRVDPMHITRLAVPSPSLEEQRRIADFLDDQVTLLDRAMALHRKQRDLLTARRGAHLSTLIEDLFERNGSIVLRRISKGIEQGSSPNCYAYPADAGMYGVLKISAVRAGYFRAEENKALPPEVQPELRYLVRQDDLLMARGSGSRELVGDVAVASPGDAQLLLPDLIYRVRLQEGVNPHFVCAALRSSRVREEMLAATRGAAGGTIKLRGDDILDLRIPRASRVEAAALAREWQPHGEEVSRADSAAMRQITLLEERKQALITAAVTGQLDVTTARAVA